MSDKDTVSIDIMEVEMSHVKEAVLDLTKTIKTLVEQIQAITALTTSFQGTAERLGSKIDGQGEELKEVKKEVTDLRIAKAAADAQGTITGSVGKIALTALVVGCGTLALYAIKVSSLPVLT